MRLLTVVGVVLYTAVILLLAAHKEPRWVDDLAHRAVSRLRRWRHE